MDDEDEKEHSAKKVTDIEAAKGNIAAAVYAFNDRWASMPGFAMGVEVMDETLYRMLQDRTELDTKTSSWILTPESVRALGGALFCERRYGVTFTFHNGADSYYGVRGWRGVLRV